MQLDEFILGSKERIVKAFLDLIILHLLSKNAMSGYEVNKALVKKFGLMIGPSTIYSKLTTLEEQGLLLCTKNRSGKVFYLTNDGKQIEANMETVLDNIFEYMRNSLSKQKMKMD